MVESDTQGNSQSTGQGTQDQYTTSGGPGSGGPDSNDLNPFIQNRHHRKPDVWCTVQGLGAER